MNRIKRSKLISCLLLLIGLAACNRGEESAVKTEPAEKTRQEASIATWPLLQEGHDAIIHEAPTQALPEYRGLGGATLVLLSDDPFLAPVPEPLRDEVVSSLRRGGDQWRRRLGRVADPLLMPDMLVSAALEAGLFRRIVWVVPSLKPEEKIDLEKVGALLSAVGMGDAGAFRSRGDGTVTGELRGTRFDVVHPAALPALKGPVALHLDLGYFIRLYRGEIKTPLLPLIGTTLIELRKADWQVAAVTVSLSNHTGRVPLSMRFLGAILQRLFAEPQLLDQPLPKNWELWGKVLYLENFFQNEEIRRLLDLMEKNDPQDPAVKYALYRFNDHTGDVEAAQRALGEAVAADRGYALEYMSLAEIARARNRPEEALTWLKKLMDAEPGDPLFRLSLVQEMVEQKRYGEVEGLLLELKKLPWSTVYYPDVQPSLDYFAMLADQETDPARKSP